MGNEYGVLHCVDAGSGYNKLFFGSGTSLQVHLSEYKKQQQHHKLLYLDGVFICMTHQKYQGH